MIAVRQSFINDTQFFLCLLFLLLFLDVVDGVGGRQIERCARVLSVFFRFVLITIRKIGTRQSYIVYGYFKSAFRGV